MELSNEKHCKICGVIFNDSCALSLHVAKAHNMDIRTYYDRYIKRKAEGICPVCFKPTDYISVSKGYSLFCSRACAVAWQRSHAEQTEIICKECGEVIVAESKNRASQMFSKHIRDMHQMSQQDYYDKYIKKEGEGICPECGKPTNFKKMSEGYSKYCSPECTKRVMTRSKAERTNEYKQFKIEEAERVITEEMRQKEWEEECRSRLAEFENPMRCSYNTTDFGIYGSFGIITEKLT